MKTIKILAELTYNDRIIHSGNKDKKAKDWFYNEILLDPQSELVLYSNEIGDGIGNVKITRILIKT